MANVDASPQPISVLISDDDPGFRTIVRKVLAHHTDIRVVGEAKTGSEAVQLATKLHPAVCVMDIEMPDLNGIDAMREILRMLPATKILMFSSNTGMTDIQEAATAGAAGFVVKNCASQLPKAIRAVTRNVGFFLGLDSPQRLNSSDTL